MGLLVNGVYKCGFATAQSAHEDTLYPLFETLDWLEARLKNQPCHTESNRYRACRTHYQFSITPSTTRHRSTTT